MGLRPSRGEGCAGKPASGRVAPVFPAIVSGCRPARSSRPYGRVIPLPAVAHPLATPGLADGQKFMRGLCAEPRKQEDGNEAARRISEPLRTITCLWRIRSLPSLRGLPIGPGFRYGKRVGIAKRSQSFRVKTRCLRALLQRRKRLIYGSKLTQFLTHTQN